MQKFYKTLFPSNHFPLFKPQCILIKDFNLFLLLRDVGFQKIEDFSIPCLDICFQRFQFFLKNETTPTFNLVFCLFGSDEPFEI